MSVNYNVRCSIDNFILKYRQTCWRTSIDKKLESDCPGLWYCRKNIFPMQKTFWSLAWANKDGGVLWQRVVCALPRAKPLLEVICVRRFYSSGKSVVFPWRPSEWNAKSLNASFPAGKGKKGKKYWAWTKTAEFVFVYLSWSIKGSNTSKTGHTQKD